MAWLNCPDCNCGPGEDHKKGCPREKPPRLPTFVHIRKQPNRPLKSKRKKRKTANGRKKSR